MKEREGKQNELHDLIVEVFRKRRKLSYFQVRITREHHWIDAADLLS